MCNCVAVQLSLTRTDLAKKPNSRLESVTCQYNTIRQKGKGSPFSIAQRRVSELIPVLGSQPAGDVSHKPGGRLSLFFVRPAVTLTTLKRAAANFAAW